MRQDECKRRLEKERQTPSMSPRSLTTRNVSTVFFSSVFPVFYISFPPLKIQFQVRPDGILDSRIQPKVFNRSDGSSIVPYEFVLQRVFKFTWRSRTCRNTDWQNVITRFEQNYQRTARWACLRNQKDFSLQTSIMFVSTEISRSSYLLSSARFTSAE